MENYFGSLDMLDDILTIYFNRFYLNFFIIIYTWDVWIYGIENLFFGVWSIFNCEDIFIQNYG